LQLARGILVDIPDARLAVCVEQITVQQIDKKMQSARLTFPNAESFKQDQF
jgi:hypothetical protein